MCPLNGESFKHDYNGNPIGNSFVTDNLIFEKDYWAIQKSDLIIANMNTFSESRPPIGSICEVAITGIQQKPIIMITDEKIYRENPFFKRFVSCWASSVEEVIEKKMINFLYKAWHSAQD
jgi:nucleoside 2-deoxyribosyltransferase